MGSNRKIRTDGIVEIEANTSVAGTITSTGLASLAGLSYPTSDGTDGQVLKTNGSGTLSFDTPSVIT